MGKLSPIEGLGQITAGSSVSGRVKSPAEGQRGIRQSYKKLTCQMRQGTVTAWQNWCEVKQLEKCLSQGGRKQGLDCVTVPLLGD